MTTTNTGGQIFVDALLRQGINSLFLIPGIQLDWAVEALRERLDEVTLYVPRHEQTTTYMADGYYRVTGRPGVAMVVPGPGVLNAGAGMATAYASNSAVVLLAGQIHDQAIGKGYGLLHEIKDQAGLIRGLTKWNAMAEEVAAIPGLITTAFAQAMSGRHRPTAVEIPHTLLQSSQAPVAPAAHFVPAPPLLDAAALAPVARALDAATLPVLYVGGGCQDASAEVQALAEHLGLPVVMSDNGRGVLSDRHPLAFSSLGGRALFAKADLVLVVGSRFVDAMAPQSSWNQAGPAFAYINVDADDMQAPRADGLRVQSDAAAALAWLQGHTTARTALPEASAQRVKAWAQAQIDAVSPQADYLRELRAAMPDDAILVNELTQVGYLARVAFPVYQPRTYIGPGYQGTLGYGFPTALGAAVGAGGRRVVSLTGDGGFGWNLQELATARKYNLPVTLIVFNDGYFGNVRAIQQRVFKANVAVDLQNPDFLTLAQAFDVPAERVDSPAALGAAVRASMAQSGPVLIECVVGDMPSPWHLLRLEPMPGTAAQAPANPLD